MICQDITVYHTKALEYI